MQTDALLGLIGICAIAFPAIVYVVLRRTPSGPPTLREGHGQAGMATLPARWWLILYAVAFVFQPIFLLRKHLEAALVRNDPSLPTMLLAQVDNGWWEELAKLLALLVVLWLARDRIKPLLQKLPSAIGLGYWAGLAYGVGEAIVLAVLFIAPNLAPIFSMNTFTPFLIGWSYAYERFWAMQIHAVMGALIGAGLWCWFNQRRAGLILWFIIAMLYHHLVDGPIILANFVPALAAAIGTLGLWFVPLLTVVGYALIALAYVLLKRKRLTPVDSPA
jgi:hypothetical protein